MCIFQSTLPREERRKKQSYNVRNRQFQSTLPREERPRRHAPAHKIARNFNPRSHERSDGDVNKIDCGGSVISIHAPTRGATVFRRAERNSCRISIHAPTRGATIPNIDIPDVAGFQSTLPREERL